METPEAVNLTEFCSILNNEQSNFLALTLDAQTHKTTIKLKVAANRKLTNGFDSTPKLAKNGTVWGTGPDALNR